MVGHKRIVPASLSTWLCIFILNCGKRCISTGNFAISAILFEYAKLSWPDCRLQMVFDNSLARINGFILLSALSLTIVSEKDKQNKRPAWFLIHAGLFSKP